MGQQQFSVCHFAGDVTYDIDGFVEKNKDSVSEIITECLANSSQTLVKSIYLEKLQLTEGNQKASEDKRATQSLPQPTYHNFI